MRNPTQLCVTCGRARDCTFHLRAEFPPLTAKNYLKRTCAKVERPKPCQFKYLAGAA